MIIDKEKKLTEEEVIIEWTSRKGNPSSKVVKLPYKSRSERKGRL